MNKIYWKTREFQYKKKSVDWYWILWTITLLLSFSNYYFFNNYIFSILIITTSVVFTIASLKKPDIKKYSIDKDNIYLDNERVKIPFSEIESYNIDLKNLKILIKLKKNLSQLIQIPFETTQNISKIDNFLSTKIKKNDKLKIHTFELILNKFIGF